MPSRLPKRSALLAKIDAVYGTDPVPTGAANAMYVYDLQVTPMEQIEQERNPVRPFFGADSAIIGGTPVKVSFSVPLAGGGAAGAAPGYGVLLRGCARNEVVAAGVDVTYGLISSAFESVTLYGNRDGVLHKIISARGTTSLDMTHKQMPMRKFEFTGIYSPPTDVVLPSLTFGATWPKSLVQNKVNTTFSLHGFAAVFSKLSIEDGVEVNWKDYVNLTEEVRITGRAAPIKGSCSVGADTLAAKDWFAIARAGTLGALAVVHGIAAGNKWQLNAANVRIGNPSEEDEDGIMMYKLPLFFYPSSAGNDEYVEKAL